MAKGDILGALALNEAEAGSDIRNIQSVATLEDGAYILEGRKSFVMNGENAELYIVFARENSNLSCFIVRRNAGVEVEKVSYLMGMRASGVSEITMSNCRVPRADRIQNDGWDIARDTLDFAKLLIGAQAVGIAQVSLDDSLRYSKERHQFGRPICKFQLVQEMLAQMATRVSAARGLVYHAAFLKDGGMDFSVQAAMAKWFASETASFAANTAVQIYGGYGYTTDFPVERYMRDAKVTEICGETSEIQKITITESLLR
jgi:butyryl-CoA dehydrogenase